MKIYGDSEYYLYVLKNDFGILFKRRNVVISTKKGLHVIRNLENDSFGLRIGSQDINELISKFKEQHDPRLYIILIKWFFERYKPGQWDNIKPWEDYKK